MRSPDKINPDVWLAWLKKHGEPSEIARYQKVSERNRSRAKRTRRVSQQKSNPRQ